MRKFFPPLFILNLLFTSALLLGQEVVLTVTTTANSGAGSLREAFAITGDLKRIVFDPILSGETITITSPLINLGQTTIDASIAGGLTIDASGSEDRIFENTAGGTLTLNSLNLTGGSPNSSGAAIRNLNNSNLNIENCCIYGNSTNNAGAIANESGSTLTMTNSTLARNTARFGGALICIDSTTILTHVTIADNTGTNGTAGIVQGTGILTLSGCIISNTNSNLGNPDLGGGDGMVIASSPNFIRSGPGNFQSFFNNDVSHVLGSVDNPIESYLAPLGDYGGPTLTMVPLSNSPAIDGFPASAIATDQRGFNITDGSHDLGAAEHGINNILVDTIEDETTDNDTLSLREAIMAAGANALIEFDPTVFDGSQAPITLSSELLIESSLAIIASNIPSGVTIDGGGNGDFIADEDETRCFCINDNSGALQEVVFNKLIIQNGSYGGSPAGANIHNLENLTIDTCQILNGRAFGNEAQGGGIYNENGSLTLTNTTVAGNQTQGDASSGGGIYNSDASLLITNSTISDNSTLGTNAHGGGIFNSTTRNEQTTTLTNCTFNGNLTPNAYGAGIHNESGLAVLTHCTIAGNTSNTGGAGVSSLGNDLARTEISNSIVQNNTGRSDLELFEDTSNSFHITGENLFGSVGPNVALGNGNTNTPPLNTQTLFLAPLGDYGGLTQTMPPLSPSPAIDAGGMINPEGSDQRGFLRFVNDALDIGAVELQLGEDFTLSANPFPFPINDFALDPDQDGTPNGIEFILGTNHLLSDSSNSRNPTLTFNENGNLSLNFGRVEDLPDGLTLCILRSTTLADNSFEIIGTYQSDNGGITSEDLEIGSFTLPANTFNFLETTPTPKAFYRLKADYIFLNDE